MSITHVECFYRGLIRAVQMVSGRVAQLFRCFKFDSGFPTRCIGLTVDGMLPDASVAVKAADDVIAGGSRGASVPGATFGLAASARYASTIALARSINPRVLAFCASKRR